jgi:hypothetical protein
MLRDHPAGRLVSVAPICGTPDRPGMPRAMKRIAAA